MSALHLKHTLWETPQGQFLKLNNHVSWLLNKNVQNKQQTVNVHGGDGAVLQYFTVPRRAIRTGRLECHVCHVRLPAEGRVKKEKLAVEPF